MQNGLICDMRNIGHFGTGDLQITVKSNEDFEKVKGLIDRVYGGISKLWKINYIKKPLVKYILLIIILFFIFSIVYIIIGESDSRLFSKFENSEEMVREFKNKEEINIEDHYISKIINQEYNDFIPVSMYIKNNQHDAIVPTSNEFKLCGLQTNNLLIYRFNLYPQGCMPIGKEWGEYYEHFLKLNYKRYALMIKEQNINSLVLQTHTIQNKASQKLALANLSLEDQKGNKKNFDVLFQQSDVKYISSLINSDDYEIDDLKEILPYSVNYLDFQIDDVIDLKKEAKSCQTHDYIFYSFSDLLGWNEFTNISSHSFVRFIAVFERIIGLGLVGFITKDIGGKIHAFIINGRKKKIKRKVKVRKVLNGKQ